MKEILEEMYDIQVRYTKPLLKENYTDKDYAIEKYENLVFKMKNIITNLQEENEKLKSYIKLTDEEAKEYMYDANKEIDRLNNIINETRRILGEYRHYSLPDEQQNAKNEAIVDEAYNQLHSNLKELKEGK